MSIIDKDEIILKLISELEKSNKQILHLTKTQKKMSETFSNIITKINIHSKEIINLKNDFRNLSIDNTNTKFKYKQIDIDKPPQVIIKPPVSD